MTAVPAGELVVDVAASVVCHRRWADLGTCLAALGPACGALSWQVTVVDNAPEGGSSSAIAREHPGARVLANREPLGFAANHNQVLAPLVERSRARYALVLNDDTELAAGSVAEMVAAMDADPDLGAVAPSVLGPDGRGLPNRLAWPTARSSWRFDLTGRTEAPDPAGGWLQGCCLLLRVEALRSVGTFDERFFLFYEDVDLCRRLLQGGWRLGTCPQARVVHQQHATVLAPASAPASLRRGLRSRYLYFAKHLGPRRAGAIASVGRAATAARAAGTALRAARHRSRAELSRSRAVGSLALFDPRRPLPGEARPGGRGRPAMLLVTPMVPSWSSSAGEQRVLTLGRLAAERYDVTLVATGGWEPADQQARVRQLRAMGIALAGGPPRRRLERALAARRYGVVVVQFWHVAESAAPVVRRMQPWARVVVDTVDLQYVRHGRAVELGYAPAENLAPQRERELSAYRAADALLFVSAGERDRYSGLGEPPALSAVVPLVAEPRRRTSPGLGGRVLFVGSFWHLPNVEGIAWFCAEVWPLVRRAVPGASLAVVGYEPTPAVRRLGDLPGVEVVGYVEDLGEAYGEARVAIAPLRVGAGVKGKVLEALAAGVPVVTTAVGAEGLDTLAQRRTLLVEDSPEGFAGSVARLLGDEELARRIGESGRDLVAELFGVARARSCLTALLDALGERRPAPAEVLRWRLTAPAAALLAAAAPLPHLRAARRRLRQSVRRSAGRSLAP